MAEMSPRQAEDPRLRALAELVHQLRPTWHRGGIIGALHAGKVRPMPELVRAAINAALDPTAETPGAIQHRDGTAWTPQEQPTPVPATRICSRCGRYHVVIDGHLEPCPRYDADVNARGLASARQALDGIRTRNTPADWSGGTR